MGSPLHGETVAQSNWQRAFCTLFAKKTPKTNKHPALGPSATAGQSSIRPEGRHRGAMCQGLQTLLGCMSPHGADGPKQQRGTARKAAERLGSALGAGVAIRRDKERQPQPQG